MIYNFLLQKYELLDSTQLEAKRLLDKHSLLPSMVLVAQQQTVGKGRYDRAWHSASGDALFTVVLQPNAKKVLWPQIAYVAALAIGETLLWYSRPGDLDLAYKWVNDILINQKKVSGILLEQHQEEFLLVGLGINIVEKNLSIQNISSISLGELGMHIKASQLIEGVLENFKELYNAWLTYGFAAVRQRWLERAAALHQKIVVKFNSKDRQGIFEGIDLEGMLLLQVEGQINKIYAGDIFFD